MSFRLFLPDTSSQNGKRIYQLANTLNASTVYSDDYDDWYLPIDSAFSDVDETYKVNIKELFKLMGTAPTPAFWNASLAGTLPSGVSLSGSFTLADINIFGEIKSLSVQVSSADPSLPLYVELCEAGVVDGVLVANQTLVSCEVAPGKTTNRVNFSDIMLPIEETDAATHNLKNYTFKLYASGQSASSWSNINISAAIKIFNV